MLIKLSGVFLLLSAGGGFSLLLAKEERRRVSILSSFVELLSYVRSQIDCFLLPVGEILQGSDPSLWAPFGLSSPPSDPSALTDLLTLSAPRLPADAYRVLLSFLRELGSSYRDQQLRSCDLALDSLRSILSRERSALPSRIRVRVCLALCAASGIAILFW